MMELPAQLKEICRFSGAYWAAWMVRQPDGWDFLASHALTKARQAALTACLAQPQVTAWLGGTLTSRRTRSRDSSAQAAELGCRRLYAFSGGDHRSLLLIGCDHLEKTAESALRLLADSSPFPSADRPAVLIAETEPELGASYNPEVVLNSVLELLTGLVPCDAAYLAIRSGDVFRVQAIWRCIATLQGLDILLQEDDFLIPMVETRQGLIVNDAEIRQHSNWKLSSYFDQPPGAWLGAPILVGQRVVGHVALVSYHANAFDAADLQQVTLHLGRLAYSIENAIVFAEAARYLQRLAMLNELASVVAIGVGTDEAARRVIQHLRRNFATELVGVYLLSADGQQLHEYTFQSHNLVDWQPLSTTVLGDVIGSGQAVRTGDVRFSLRYGAAVPDVRSELAVPLRYHGKAIGALVLQSVNNNAFSQQDEQLMLVIASQLAGLIENIRLNEETRERAQRLQDSVRQLQAVRETALDITANLDLEVLLKRVVHRARELVDARGAELGLFDPQEQAIRVVVAENPWYDNVGAMIPLMAGVAGRVAACGEPLAVADYNAWVGRLQPDQQAPFRAVAGVPLKFGDQATDSVQVIGTLTMLDDRPGKVFSAEDVQLLELLAPQVAVSIRNARLYQELQERIEAQRLAERRLLRSARLAAVGEMAASVAHELNNPLTTVVGFVELALEDIPTDMPIRPDLELVMREAQRARDVVRRLLDFSRPMEDVRVRTDVNELVRETLALIKHQIRTYGVTSYINFASKLPWVLVDPNQIKQVLLNLIHNALQAMSADAMGVSAGGDLTITTDRQIREGSPWVTLAVRDTGVGISPENLERIFEPFFTTRATGSGTGLGLSISYGIVTDHGGFMEVESTPGKGSCFTAYLPVEAG
jgi:signal transduction histidine kinase/putative methionine-R-sulfoxide reductase with GAF domain